MGNFPNLEESVLTVDSISFARGTKVVVSTLRTLVADTSDRSQIATIAYDTLMDFLRLSNFLLLLTVSLHEVLVDHSLDLFFGFFKHLIHATEAVTASLLALAAGFVFLGVDLCTFALEAFDVVSKALTSSSTLLARLTVFVDFSAFALSAF